MVAFCVMPVEEEGVVDLSKGSTGKSILEAQWQKRKKKKIPFRRYYVQCLQFWCGRTERLG
jgi:hypothetical protein